MASRMSREFYGQLAPDLTRGKKPLEEFIEIMEDEWEGYRVKEEKLTGVYPKEKIQRDLEQVEEKKDSLAGQSRPKESIAAEYLLLEAISNHLLFNRKNQEADINLIPAAEFDDYFNGIDIIVAARMKGEKNWHYIGIDATTSEDEGELMKKLSANYRKITSIKQLPKADYYLPQTENKGEKPGSVNLIRIVLGLSQKRVRDLAAEYVDSKGKNVFKPSDQLELIQETIDQIMITIEQTANRFKDKRYSDYVFADPKRALDFAEQYGQRENADPAISKILQEHAEILEYFLNLQKEKSPLGEINPERTHERQFRLLAPKKSLAA